MSSTAAEFRKVTHMQFGVLGPEEIRAMSVMAVETAEGFERGKPKRGGLMDARMGTVSHDVYCDTCGGPGNVCPGHFGHIDLALPIYHHGYLNYVYKVLQSVCYYCGKLLIDSSMPGAADAMRIRSRIRRLSAVHVLCRKHPTCESNAAEQQQQGDAAQAQAPQHKHAGCGNIQPRITRTGPLQLTIEFRGDNAGPERKRVMPASEARDVLRKISDDDARALGFDPHWSRPEWLILTVLPVPPPPVRPTVVMDSVARGEDDLTRKLSDVVKANIALKRVIEGAMVAHMITEHLELLQFHVTTMFNNEIPNLPQSMTRKGRPIKSIRQRMKGKEGRIRGNLMGKRVDFSGRTVITPDPNISIDEVGVPRSIAMTLTIPEIVTPLNLERMRELVNNGPLQYPGARYIIRTNKQRVDLRFFKNAADMHLDYGYVVERHLQDGDIVVFNRQPSLHKMSMMGHRVRVMPYSSFRLNLCCTTPYNADFDGDEMNLHVPQSFEARAEVRELMMVPRNIVTPAANRPVIGIVQDALLGSRLITRRSTFIERDVLFNIVMWLASWNGRLPQPAVLKPRPLWTGKQIFSMFLPEVNLTRGGSADDEIFPSLEDTSLEIVRGELLTGMIDSKIIGPKASGGLQHVIWKEFGPEAAKAFLNQVQAVVNYWLLQIGFSTGISDTIADKTTNEEINMIIARAKDDVSKLIIEMRAGNLEPLPGHTLAQTFERRVNPLLNSARTQAGNSAQRFLKASNNIKLMVDAGSKGNILNISQITACVGQQNVEGQRVPFGFNNRTLPHFLQHDQGPESRGFVQNSYLRGLTPQEFFFHAMGGREGIIDTACKSVTGDTELVVQEGGVTKLVRIGEWVDAHMSAAKDRVVRTPADRNLECLDLSQPTYIPTTDADGHMSWGTITAVTRHDPGTSLYEVKTSAGKRVVVAESQSLLVWDAHVGKLLPKASPAICVGDLLPVTASLPSPPIMLDAFDLSKYLSSTSATDTTASLLTRLALNKPNGIFIGLFLAEGNVNVPSGHVVITNNDTAICDFVKTWFTDMGISWSEETKVDHICTVTGYSTILAKFLDKACGHGAAAKKVPDEAFSAPSDFVAGLINGYISGSGTMSANSVESNFASSRLTDGISMLCTRLGMFGNVDIYQQESDNLGTEESLPSHRLSIQAQWASRFAEQIGLINASKQAMLKALQASQEHCNYSVLNDVVLDKVIEIQVLSAAAYPRLYDLTVPSTLNFGLANGLQVRDTSETGYIQRRLMKSMEDIQAKYDGTIRNSAGGVLQFLYGEDGMDGAFVEAQRIDSLAMNNDKMRATYLFPGISESTAAIAAAAMVSATAVEFPPGLSVAAAEDIKTDAGLRAMLWEEFKQLIHDRDELRRIAPSFTGTLPDAFHLPCNMRRLIANAQRAFHVDMRRPSELHPRAAIEGVRALLTNCRMALPTPDEDAADAALTLFATLVRSALASKRVICEYRLSPPAWEWLLGEAETQFHRALVHPGESVGPLSAQSIGEPATQMTLNTFHYAGVSEKNVTLGVPRLRELINVAKRVRTPWLTVFLQPLFAGDRDRAKGVQSALEYTTLRRITASSQIIYDPDVSNTVVEEDRDFVRAYYEMPDDENLKIENLSPWLLRLVLDGEMMTDKHLTLSSIAARIDESFEDKLHVIFSDDNAAKLVLRIRFVYDQADMEYRRHYATATVPPESAAAESQEDGAAAENEDPDEQDIRSLLLVEKRMLSDLPLCGIQGIEKVSMSNPARLTIDAATGTILPGDKAQKEWALDTGGSNLALVMAHPSVDSTRVVSNDVVEVLRVLGVEAARAALHRELRSVLSFDGSYVNNRHVAVLSDVMTYGGALMAISRHGVNRGEDAGPLMRASFEESTEQLLQAAAFAEDDDLRGISPNIMLGQLAPLGTGAFAVYLDHAQLEHAVTLPATDYLPPPVASALAGMASPTRAGFTTPQRGDFSPVSTLSPYDAGVTFSPVDMGSPGYGAGSGASATSPAFVSSPRYSPSSPGYSPSSPAYSPTSPAFEGGAATAGGAAAAAAGYSPTSPAYSPTSPAYNASSPAYNASSPAYSPSSPAYSPSSPSYKSPAAGSTSGGSGTYSPSVSSGRAGAGRGRAGGVAYSPSSPAYTPSSPAFQASPQYSPSSPTYSPSSPRYSPSGASSTGGASPGSLSSASASPGANASYSPSSPAYSPTSPPPGTYSPTEPADDADKKKKQPPTK